MSEQDQARARAEELLKQIYDEADRRRTVAADHRCSLSGWGHLLSWAATLAALWLAKSQQSGQAATEYLLAGKREAYAYHDGRSKAFRECADELTAALSPEGSPSK